MFAQGVYTTNDINASVSMLHVLYLRWVKVKLVSFNHDVHENDKQNV